MMRQLVQPTSELRRLYVLARARLAGFEVEVVERLARADRAPTEPRETKAAQLKIVPRAREGRRGLRRQGERLRDVLRASIVCETVAELQTLGDELRAPEAAGTVQCSKSRTGFGGIRRRRGIATSTSACSTAASSPSCRFTSGRSLSIAERQHVAYGTRARWT